MKLSQLLLTTSLCAAVAMPAFAQQRTFSDVDTNGDGQLSRSELEAVFGTRGARSFLDQNDLDDSGSVSVAEIQVSQDDDESDGDDESDETDDESDEDDESNDESDESSDEDDDESDDDEDDEDDDEDDSDESDDDEGGDESSDDEDGR